tara:strand:- start:31 stop:207 length:177 start_codon:yes stop_codon:yes gene_type:complete
MKKDKPLNDAQKLEQLIDYTLEIDKKHRLERIEITPTKKEMDLFKAELEERMAKVYKG